MDVSLHPAACHDRPALSHVTIAIPIRDEAARMRRLLVALAAAAERSALPVTALVLANNCRDHSAGITAAFAHPLLRIDLHEVTMADASAGGARRLAMELAAQDGALVMTTDGDAVPDPGWIAAALRHANAGADLVCGTIAADCQHVLATASGSRITRAEEAYRALLHETRHAIDQMAGRQGAVLPHYVESAASMAIRADSYRKIGGLPDIRSSEDRALVHLAEGHGLSVRYAEDMHAWVSARLHGRATGGMAEALRERMSEADPLADQALLPVPVVADLWSQALGGLPPFFPSRAAPCGPRPRASDLEAWLPGLQHFTETTLRPQFAHWQRARKAA